MKQTTIQISEEVWKNLNSKKNMGQDFDDVLREILNLKKAEDVKK